MKAEAFFEEFLVQDEDNYSLEPAEDDDLSDYWPEPGLGRIIFVILSITL